MTNILGARKLNIAIADSDGLIAMMYQDDALFVKAKNTIQFLVENDYQVIFPVTTITETITTLTRKFNKPEIATYIVNQIKENLLVIEDIDEDLLKEAFTIFDPTKSKQNTIFDALVVCVARKYNTNIIFSFDNWYEKLGLTLAINL